jgi:cytochrome c nitrite reductase small subunit
VSRGILRFWPVLAVPLGVALGLGGYTLVYAEGLSYLSDDPEACANCHVMNEQYEGWLAGPHRAVAVCNDCHVPHDPAGKWLSKARNGFHHSRAFTLQDFHEPIRITPRNAAALQAGCVHCHDALVHGIVQDRDAEAEAIRCARCHRGVGHGPTR